MEYKETLEATADVDNENLENENENKTENMNELENSYNCLIDDELIQDPTEKEKLRERIKEKMEVAKK